MGETVEEKQVQKFECPLSDRNKVYIIFEAIPTTIEFSNLRALIDVAELSMTGSLPAKALPVGEKPQIIEQKPQVKRTRNRTRPVIAPKIEEPKKEEPKIEETVVVAQPEKKPRRARTLHPLPKCVKHPESERSIKTNRCIECDKEHARNMSKAKADKKNKQESINLIGTNGNGNGYIYSEKMKCPACGILARLRRDKDAHPFEGYWLHEEPGMQPCRVRLDWYPIKEDPTYHENATN